MPFNNGRIGRRPAGTVVLLACLTFGSSWPAGEPQDLSPLQSQALFRLKAAWSLGDAIGQSIWAGFDSAKIPVLVVESRPGREPFALLYGHPSPPAAFRPVEGPAGTRPSLHVAGNIVLPSPALSPVTLNGVPTALYRVGGSHPETLTGGLPAELEILGIVHQMVHVHLATRGGAGFPHMDSMEPVPSPPEAIALAAVESKVLAEILYAGRSKPAYVEDLVGQFLAVRRAREPLLGASAAVEAEAETREGPAVYTEFELLRLLGRKKVLPPPTGAGEAGYHTFRYSSVWRLGLVFGHLVQPPSHPADVAARAPYAGAAMAIALSRLQVDWRPRIAGPGAPRLIDLLAERVGLDPSRQEGILRQACLAFGYEAALAVARVVSEPAGR
jgi:hypothetical protein